MGNPKRKLWIWLIIVFVILAAIAYALGRSSRSVKVTSTGSIQLHSSQLLARNVQYPRLVNPGTLRFYTGSAFADFDLSSLKSKSITPEYRLPRALSILWNGNSVILNLDRVTANDDVYEEADQLARANPSWWLWNLDTNKLSQIRSSQAGYGVVGAAWDKHTKNSLFVLSQNGTDPNQFLEEQSGGNPIVSSKVKGITILGQVASGLAVSGPKSRVMVWANGKLKQIISPADNPSVVNDRYIVYSNTDSSASQASIFEYDTAKPSTLTKVVESASNTGNSTVLRDGILMLPPIPDKTATPNKQSPQGQLLENDGKAITSTSISLSGGDLIMDGQLNYAFKLDQSSQINSTSLVIINSSDGLFMLSSNSSMSQQVSPYPFVFLPSNTLRLPDATVAYDVYNNRLDVYPFAVNNQNTRSKILNELSPYGDTNQIVKIWHPAGAPF